VNEEDLRRVPTPFEPDLSVSEVIPGLPDFLEGPGKDIPVFQDNMQTRARQTDADAVALRRSPVQVMAFKVGVHIGVNSYRPEIAGTAVRPPFAEFEI
jgi:hypothetical protein